MSGATRFVTSHWSSLLSSAIATVVVGFASTILVVIEGARAVGASPAQQASVAAILCYAMAATSFILSARYRMPIVVAWSTPGSVLIATSAMGITFPQAIGAFVFAGVLMTLTAVITPLARAIERMPAAIAAAMMAGVLLRYVLGVPPAALSSPALTVPLIAAFFALRFFVPMYSVPIVVALGLLITAMTGAFSTTVPIAITPLTFDLPEWNLQAVFSLGIPLYLVTMASQNLPGFAVLRASGYQPPVSACLLVTGLGSILAAPFGSHAINMAAITASLATGPDTHPDPGQRWKYVYAFAPLYVVFGLAAGTCVAAMAGLPKDLVTAIAGLALFSPLMGGMSAMMKETRDIEPALVTFLTTASGISLFGIGAAFWGLVAGLILWAAQRAARRG
ncbi:MAG: benzoate/H(+) symporter BenE family transporter [Phyllobacteriaceae bacterium]|nr:benzoate/H(+) symporter BenE family transporter [Phyllobacteriaceae bacterium]